MVFLELLQFPGKLRLLPECVVQSYFKIHLEIKADIRMNKMLFEF